MQTDGARANLLRRGLAMLVLAAVAAVLAPLSIADRRPPLVMIVVFDALRADHLTQYGYPVATSPGLDGLAAVATSFTRAYAPTSYTTASTASLMTGLSPQRHGAVRQGAALDASVETLAEVLGRRGYVARGVSFNPVVAHATGFTQGFRDFAEREAGSPFNLYPDIGQGLDRIRGWLDAEPDERKLIYFQVMNTHGPYLVPESAQETLLGRPPADAFQYYRGPMGDILAGDLARRADVDDAYLGSAIERYDTAIRHATDQLGAFLEELRAAGRFDDALIVVTADHGDEFFEHGGFSHGYTLYEEVIRVPLFVKMPGQRESARVDARVTLMDVLPTLAEAVGARPAAHLDGSSLLPWVRGDLRPDERPLHLSVDFPPRLVATGRIEGHHKLVAIEQSYEGVRRGLRLYDLEADPGEQNDLAGAQPALAQSMLTRLMHHTRALRADAPPPASIARDLDLESLRALGYFR